MKKTIFWSLLSFLVGAALVVLVVANPFGWHLLHPLQARLGISLPEAADEGGTLWTCGMHPQVIQNEPGTCPICHMDLTPLKGTAPAARPAEPAERKVKYWRAPMDPSYVSDKPGKSPMGMDLVPVYEDELESQPGVVRSDPGFVQTIGVDSEAVVRRDLPQTIRTVGTLTYNDQQIHQVTTKYEGWIEKAYVNYIGEPVARGQKLFEIYSPQLVTTQQEYLQAIDYAERLSAGNYPEVAARARSLLEATRERLAYWDISDDQVRTLEKERKVRRTLTVVSEHGGLVVEKMEQALAGMYVRPGMNLFKIVDLSTIWVEAEVFEDQVSWLEVGQTAQIEIPYQPGKTYRGRIRYVYPFFNERTRSLRLSIELPNPRQELRKGMYANVLFEVPSARGVLVVPQEAVIHSGLRDVVVIDLGDGTFQVRTVETGVSAEGLVEITEGVREGERVVVSSQFLIDSESNLREAIRKLVGAPSQGEGDRQ